MSRSRFMIEEVSDPAESARSRAQHARARRNSDWLQAHWAELLPRAHGTFVAVAGQEAFLAKTPEEAWAWAETVHPDDDGALVQYVRPKPGPRFSANRW